MSSQRLGRQPDLFAPGGDLFDPREEQEPPPADFIARIRGELQATLALAAGAEVLPWPDLTKALLTEMRFTSIANWLPLQEADALRSAFNAELDRLYSDQSGSFELPAESEP
jgi:hypothetical protein